MRRRIVSVSSERALVEAADPMNGALKRQANRMLDDAELSEVIGVLKHVTY